MKTPCDQKVDTAALGEPDEAAAGTKYYDYNYLPAYRAPREFPVVVRPGGEAVVYDLEAFFREAQTITKVEFDRMVQARKK